MGRLSALNGTREKGGFRLGSTADRRVLRGIVLKGTGRMKPLREYRVAGHRRAQ